jgi:hypothetical protein
MVVAMMVRVMMVLLRASDGDVNGESNDDGGDYITLHYIIIQRTPHWSFSVTDYIKYYDTYVTYLAYTRKNAQVDAILMKTGLNNVLLPALFIAA